MRVGEAKTRYTDVRIIVATNKDLGDLVKKGHFRQDLYYRLKTVTLNVPTLRNRLEDISPLVERFALEFTRSNDILYRGFMPDAVRLLKQYDWPGNVRELKNFVERILVLEKGERITAEMTQKELQNFLKPLSEPNIHLPVAIEKKSAQAEIDIILRQLFLLRQDTELIRNLIAGKASDGTGIIRNVPMIDDTDIDASIPEKSMEITEDGHTLIRDDAIGDMRIRHLEREAVTRTLRFFNNNRRKTARSLGMSERTLYRKIEEYNIEPKIKRRQD